MCVGEVEDFESWSAFLKENQLDGVTLDEMALLEVVVLQLLLVSVYLEM